MPASKRGATRQILKRARRKGFVAVTPAQQHRSRRGRRYTRRLRADNHDLERRLDNAVEALRKVAGERRRLTRAKDVADAALGWEAAARTRAKDDDGD